MLQFLPVTFEDWKLLLDWRNDLTTRRNSINSEEITVSDHKKWLREAIQNPARAVYLVKDKDVSVGTIRVDYQKDLQEISWTISPGERGKGYGKTMVKQFSDKLNGVVMARIKKGNISSIKIALFAGLKYYKESEHIVYYKKESLL